MTDLTQEQVASQMLKLKAKREKFSGQYNAVDDKLKAQYNELESDFLSLLPQTVDSITIEGYTFKRNLSKKYSISDKVAFVQFVVEQNNYDLITTAAVSAKAMPSLLDSAGQPPSFIGLFQQVKLSVTKKAGKSRTFT
jgi:molybdopterin-guanine dinucleotide biosynthesis protein